MLVALFVFVCRNWQSDSWQQPFQTQAFFLHSFLSTFRSLSLSPDHETYSFNRVPGFLILQTISAELFWTLVTCQKYTSEWYFELRAVSDFHEPSICDHSNPTMSDDSRSSLSTIVDFIAYVDSFVSSDVRLRTAFLGIFLSCHHVSMSALTQSRKKKTSSYNMNVAFNVIN